MRKIPKYEGKRKAPPPTDTGRPRKRPLRFVLSRIFIIAGTLLILTAVAYEALNYPWQTLGVSDRAEWHDPDYLADPTLDPAYTVVRPSLPSPSAPPPRESPGGVPSDGASPAPSELLMPGDGDSFVPPKKEREIPPGIGIIKIPKLKVSEFIYAGANLFELGLGVGHVTGTASLGGEGNLCLAGHRSTISKHPFRYLDLIGEGDDIFVKDDSHTYTYTAYEQFIVPEAESHILYPVAGEQYCLTLITCHPYGFRTHRLIVRARLTAVDGITPEEFFAAQDRSDPEADPSGPPSDSSDPPPGISPDPSSDPSPDSSSDPASGSHE